MVRRRLATCTGILTGLLIGLLLWGLQLGAHVNRHDPGLWTLRFRHVLDCGLDYNGPPYAEHAALWLTCGERDGWRLWPLGQ